MLADEAAKVQSGTLDPDIHLPSTAKFRILEFVASQLPLWRDHPERPKVEAETKLTEHLCDFLGTATYWSAEWSHIQFRTETADEVRGGRKIDLSVKPRAAALIIENRRHTQFDTVLPIECKRLPTPEGAKRDEREYVFNQYSSTGGIQRFKSGNHAAEHNLAAMIGYIQQETRSFWFARIHEWIDGLVAIDEPGWSAKDIPLLQVDDASHQMALLQSTHDRSGGLSAIELRHLWIEMVRET